MSPADMGVLVLLTSEVVSNAVVHAATSLGLVVRSVHEGIQVEVSDGDNRLPLVDQQAPGSISGHGLTLVAFLSQSWGAIPNEDGKMVWFRFGPQDVPEPRGRFDSIAPSRSSGHR
jgi:hypothetical protein